MLLLEQASHKCLAASRGATAIKLGPQKGCSEVRKRWILPHEPDVDIENDVRARNGAMNYDGLGVVWYTSAKADFDSKSPQKEVCCDLMSTF